MKTIMKLEDLKTVDQLTSFLSGTQLSDNTTRGERQSVDK